MSQVETRPLRSKIALLDRGNNVVRWIDKSEAEELIRAGEVETLGTRRKVHAVRWISRLPENPNLVVPLRLTRLGRVHRRETYDNPRNVWSIDRIPDSARGAFMRVIDDVAA